MSINYACNVHLSFVCVCDSHDAFAITLFCLSISHLAALYQISFCIIHYISKKKDESSSKVLNHWAFQLNVHDLTNRHRGTAFCTNLRRVFVSHPLPGKSTDMDLLFCLKGFSLVVFVKIDLVYGMVFSNENFNSTKRC